MLSAVPLAFGPVVVTQLRQQALKPIRIRAIEGDFDAASSAAAAAAGSVNAAVVTDTLLDVAVYTLLAGVAALTVYSVVVTLQSSNEKYGGWTRPDDEDLADAAVTGRQPGDRLRPGAVYDPATDQWTYPKAEPPSARVGRAPSSDTATEGACHSRLPLSPYMDELL